MTIDELIKEDSCHLDTEWSKRDTSKILLSSIEELVNVGWNNEDAVDFVDCIVGCIKGEYGE